jgi:hypothetical protein
VYTALDGIVCSVDETNIDKSVQEQKYKTLVKHIGEVYSYLEKT